MGRGALLGERAARWDRLQAFHLAFGPANDWPARRVARGYWATRTNKIKMAARQPWLARRARRTIASFSREQRQSRVASRPGGDKKRAAQQNKGPPPSRRKERTPRARPANVSQNEQHAYQQSTKRVQQISDSLSASCRHCVHERGLQSWPCGGIWLICPPSSCPHAFGRLPSPSSW